MKCQNCGEHEANVKYTQIINGVKKEMHLCEICSQELGDEINFNIPINLSSFLSDLFLDENNLLPNFENNNIQQCNICKTTYSDFIKDGKFGCENCYNVFSSRVDSILKNLHGSNVHIGRKGDYIESNKLDENNKETGVLDLERKLKQAIKEEKYEEAAKIRDEIKKIGQQKE